MPSDRRRRTPPGVAQPDLARQHDDEHEGHDEPRWPTRWGEEQSHHDQLKSEDGVAEHAVQRDRRTRADVPSSQRSLYKDAHHDERRDGETQPSNRKSLIASIRQLTTGRCAHHPKRTTQRRRSGLRSSWGGETPRSTDRSTTQLVGLERGRRAIPGGRRLPRRGPSASWRRGVARPRPQQRARGRPMRSGPAPTGLLCQDSRAESQVRKSAASAACMVMPSLAATRSSAWIARAWGSKNSTIPAW